MARCEDCEGPDMIFLPEVTFDVDKFMNQVARLHEKKKSVVAQLRTAPPAQEQRKKQRKKAQKGSDNHEALYL